MKAPPNKTDKHHAPGHTRTKLPSPRSARRVGAQGGKNFLDKDATPEEMIKGLLGCMPMGARTVQYIPAEGVQALADGGVPCAC